MKNFSEYLDEMAHISGILSNNSYSLKGDFEHYSSLKETKIYKSKIGSKKYRIYEYSNGINSIFFLSTEDKEYKGQISFQIHEKSLIIKTSHKESDIQGFYVMMFSIILNDKRFFEILSDTNISAQTLKSYTKLTKNNLFLLKIKGISGYIDKEDYIDDSFEKTIKNDTANRCSISLKHFLLEDYYSKINNKMLYKNHYKKMFENEDETINQILFGEKWSII